MSKGPWKKKDGAATDPKTKPEKQKDPKQKEEIRKSTTGREIRPDIPPEPASPQEPEEGEVLELTDEELELLASLLFQEGGNLLLRVLKRQLITDQEAKPFGKLSKPKLKKLLKDKVNIGWTPPLIYAALVLVSKPLTPEGEKLKKEAEEKRKAAQVGKQNT